MGTINGGTIISFTPSPSLHAVTSRMPSHPTGCANFTFQIPSIANAAKKNTNSAERRANHNAVERARRECLNTKFQELAHALPSLAQVRRPSKSTIVQKSLEFIYVTRQKHDMHDKEMRNMIKENDALREEINRLREQLGIEPLPPREESKPAQADDAKEDAKVSKQANSVESSNEADMNSATNTVQQSASSASNVQIKSEDPLSEEDASPDNSEDDFEQEQVSLLNDHAQSLIYPQTLIDTSGLQAPPGFASGFDLMDMAVSPMVETESLSLNFEQSPVVDEFNPFCDPFPPKFYPSPPYEATMADYANHMHGFAATMSPDSPHIV